MIITLLLSSIINNAATTLVMAPMAIASATKLQVNPDAFFMAVAIGASCRFSRRLDSSRTLSSSVQEVTSLVTTGGWGCRWR